jgi:hypothetical protein
MPRRCNTTPRAMIRKIGASKLSTVMRKKVSATP